jgi:hypothetical protein
MVKVHRSLIERTGQPAVLLDTPYGFQENADDISARAQHYFRDAVGTPIEAAEWRTPDDTTVDRERALARVAAARYVFAGPGSPTYALRVWNGTPLRDALLGVLAGGGGVTFASAAALTLGALTVPVYEVYKVGEPPAWREGLDLLAAVGLRVALIPHYDNAEGGTHDTRYCYLGERRLRMLEATMPAGTSVLGVDEHTGLVIDLAAGRAEVVGNGVVTVRRDGRSVTHAAGAELPISALAEVAGGAPATTTPVGPAPAQEADGATSILGDAERLWTVFDGALATGDVDAATGALLDLEAAFVAWSADVTQSDETDRARAILRRMIVRLGELARLGARDPRELLAPVVDAALDVRDRARTGRQFELADALRDGLLAAGVEVHDTPDGSSWELHKDD